MPCNRGGTNPSRSPPHQETHGPPLVPTRLTSSVSFTPDTVSRRLRKCQGKRPLFEKNWRGRRVRVRKRREAARRQIALEKSYVQQQQFDQDILTIGETWGKIGFQFPGTPF